MVTDMDKGTKKVRTAEIEIRNRIWFQATLDFCLLWPGDSNPNPGPGPAIARRGRPPNLQSTRIEGCSDPRRRDLLYLPRLGFIAPEL